MELDPTGGILAAIATLIFAVAFLVRRFPTMIENYQRETKEAIEKRFKHVEDDLLESKQKAEKLSTALYEAKDEIYGIKLQVAAIQGEKKALTEINLRLTKEIEDAKELIGGLKEKVQTLERQLNELETQRSNLLNQAADDRERLMAENSRLTLKIEEMQKTIDALNDQVQRATVRVAELEGQLAAAQEAAKAQEPSEDTVPIPPEELVKAGSNSHESTSDPAVNSRGE